jgi:hypothetical protein
MLWLGTAVTLVAGVVARMVVLLGKRPVKPDDLGSVSHRWIVDHRVD